MTRDEVTKIVLAYDRTNDLGFTSIEEALLLLKNFDEMINIERFHNAKFGNTVGVTDSGLTLTYPVDLITAIMCGLEDRDITQAEWD